MPGYLITPLFSGASSVPFSPSGNISANTVQDAIEELDTEKIESSSVSASLSNLEFDINNIEMLSMRSML